MISNNVLLITRKIAQYIIMKLKHISQVKYIMIFQKDFFFETRDDMMSLSKHQLQDDVNMKRYVGK